MCKAFILAIFGCVALIEARPSYLPTATAVLPAYHLPEHHLEYAPTIVGHTAYALPTAVSHQSQTIIHEKRPYLRPIVEHTPILKTTYPAHVVQSAYLPTAAAYGIPTTAVYAPGIGSYASLYDAGWGSGLSPWIK